MSWPSVIIASALFDSCISQHMINIVISGSYICNIYVLYSTETVNDLVIVRVSKHSGTCKGGDEVFLLCEKVNKGECHQNFG